MAPCSPILLRWSTTWDAVGYLMVMVSTSTTGRPKLADDRRDPASLTLASGEVLGETPPSLSISATEHAILIS